jgi:hypothetical protein
VCGSSSRFVQVTVLPTRTVTEAGAKAKLSMLTWSPATGADAVDEPVPADAPGIEGIPLMPGIPGVALAPDPKVTDGCAAGRDVEHPASRRPTANAAA